MKTGLNATSAASPRYFKKGEIKSTYKQVDEAHKRLVKQSHPWRGTRPLSDEAKAKRAEYLNNERQQIM
jgi:hypothetical protein